LASKVGLTAVILAQYQSVLGNNQSFQAWVAAAQAANRLLVKRAEEAPSCLQQLHADSVQYGVASYFSASRLFLDSHSRPTLDTASLQQLGIEMFDVSSPPPSNIPGDNPIYSLSLIDKGVVDFDVLDRFVAPEDCVIIYDKYINEPGMQLIEYMARKLRSGATLHVRTSSLDRRCKSTIEIGRRIAAANSSISFTCKEVTVAFRQQAHDRYIFFGARLQAVFTAGLDAFGPISPNGLRSNKQSKITVYAVDASFTLTIESQDGSILTSNCSDASSC
jgi:hypothetical protein